MLPAGSQYEEVSIGRVMVSKKFRNHGLGRRLMEEAHDWCESNYKSSRIRLNAQYYLESFYHSLQYISISPPYDDGGIAYRDVQRMNLV